MPINDSIVAKFAVHDAAITQWFDGHDWPVTDRDFAFDLGVLAWRHDKLKISRTIRITRAILEDYAPEHLMTLFETTGVASAIAAYPGKYVILHRKPSGGVGLAILDAPPTQSRPFR